MRFTMVSTRTQAHTLLIIQKSCIHSERWVLKLPPAPPTQVFLSPTLCICVVYCIYAIDVGLVLLLYYRCTTSTTSYSSTPSSPSTVQYKFNFDRDRIVIKLKYERLYRYIVPYYW